MKILLEGFISCFETRKRDSGESFVCLKGDTSEAIRDAFRDIHDVRFGPDNFRYETILSLMEDISRYDFDTIDELYNLSNEICDSLVDVYNYDLIKWLGSHSNRTEYCDEAIDDLGAKDIISILSCGQFLEIQELFYNIANYLEANNR